MLIYTRLTHWSGIVEIKLLNFCANCLGYKKKHPNQA